jgi:hypothetical protein
VQDSAEPFDRQELEFAQIRHRHQTRGFSTPELLERRSQPSGNLCRNIFNLPQRHQFLCVPPFGFNCQIEPPQGFGTSQIKFLAGFNLKRVAAFNRPFQTSESPFLNLFQPLQGSRGTPFAYWASSI